MSSTEAKARGRALPALRYILANMGLNVARATASDVDALWDRLDDIVKLKGDPPILSRELAVFLSARGVTPLLQLVMEVLDTPEIREELWICPGQRPKVQRIMRNTLPACHLIQNIQAPLWCRAIVTLSWLAAALIESSTPHSDVHRAVVEWRVLGPRLIRVCLNHGELLKGQHEVHAGMRLYCLNALKPVLAFFEYNGPLKRPPLPYVVLPELFHIRTRPNILDLVFSEFKPYMTRSN